MNSETALKGMISRASIILQEAEYLKEKGAWNMVVRRSQETVELALKLRPSLSGNRGPAHS